ncbi:MAG: Mrp/NBP35 family ATP-binding protein [Candidatus Anammoximicrobium sp.]|mgnify:CR=1 FL=1|nr:Mrp/NBP35 family ATP-binding protein [Candidatus Anammoximicrobium sp.]
MANGQMDAAAVQAALAEVKDPESGRSLTKLDQVKNVQVQDGKLSLELSLTTWSAPLWRDVLESVQEKLRATFPQLASLDIRQSVQERPAPKRGEVGLTAKSVIAVGSGKGGVGKSTIAATLAFGLKRAGCKVGLMDADVYGPSIPHLLGLSGRPTIENERIQPIAKDGMPVMSMGLLVPKEEAVIWRGPMLHGAVTQFLRDTNWGDLDYLIIDMPPGTGDIALSLSQLLPLTGAVVVCTPQDVALLDAVKAIAMFRKVRIRVLGVIENMSGFVCPGCGQRHDIFGSGGARQRAEELGVPFLGDVPIQLKIREYGDEGRTEANFAEPAIGACLEGICYRLVKALAESAAAAPPQPQLPVLG